MPQILLKTSGGNVVCPPDLQVATKEDGAITYKPILELRKQATVFMTKTAAEELTLNDIKTTLYERSQQYRDDTAVAFVRNSAQVQGPETPTVTRLSVLLKSALENQGMGSANTFKAAKHIYKMLPEGHGYTISAVVNWLSGEKVMLPIDTKAMEAVVRTLDHRDLTRWFESLKAQNFAPVRRIRALHKSFMAAVAVPKGEGKGGASVPVREGSEKVVRLADFMPFIKAQYGEDVFKPVTIEVTVSEISELGGGGAGAGWSKGGSGIRREIQGFRPSDPEKRKELLVRYGGKERSREIEKALEQRKKIIIDEAVPIIFDSTFIIAKKKFLYLFSAATKQKGSLLTEEEAVPIIGEVVRLYLNIAETLVAYEFGHIFASREEMIRDVSLQHEDLKKIINDSEKKAVLAKGDIGKILKLDLSTIRDWSRRLGRFYDNSRVEKSILSRAEWLNSTFPDFDGEAKRVTQQLGAVPRKDWNAALEESSAGLLGELKEALDIFDGSEELAAIRAKLQELEKAANLPAPLALLQLRITGQRSGEHRIIKLMSAYGISSLHSVFGSEELHGEMRKAEMRLGNLASNWEEVLDSTDFRDAAFLDIVRPGFSHIHRA